MLRGNDYYLLTKIRFENDANDQSFLKITTIFENLKSFSIFDPRILKQLYVKGYASLVVKILVKLNDMLKQ